MIEASFADPCGSNRYPVDFGSGDGQPMLRAWRGERALIKLFVRADRPTLDVAVGLALAELPADCVRIHTAFVTQSDDGESYFDALQPTDTWPLPDGEVFVYWLLIDVPRDAAPGKYTGTVMVTARDSEPVALPLDLHVLPAQLPEPKDWSFYLDLWQHPRAIARWHEMEPWSDEHFERCRPYLQMLADGGQKVVTATIIHDPWNSQTFDPFDSMIVWHGISTGFEYDFTNFYRWVRLCESVGIDRRIECYSLTKGPGGKPDFDLQYVDAANQPATLTCKIDSDLFRGLWAQFLPAFEHHLEENGWLDKTCIALDEAGEDVTGAMIKLVKSIAPRLGISLAGNWYPAFSGDIDDYCAIYPGIPPDAIEERRQRGQTSTYYVCCGPLRPNTMTATAPADIRRIGWQAAHSGHEGFLRWAYNSWPEDPFFDSRFGPWPAGDTFLVYPGQISSVRFELLRKGIEEFEMIRILRERGIDLSDSISSAASLQSEDATAINAAREHLNDSS